MINRALRNLALDSLSYTQLSELYMHDWWLALLARYYGETQFIDKPLLDYRQHCQNQVGVFNHKLRLFYYFIRFKSYWKIFVRQSGKLKCLNNLLHNMANHTVYLPLQKESTKVCQN